MTVNARLADRYTHHAVDLVAVENAEVRRMHARLNGSLFAPMLRSIESRLSRIRSRGAGVFRLRGYLGMMRGTRDKIKVGINAARLDLADRLYELALAEARYTVHVLGAEIPVDLTARLPSRSTFRGIVARTPIAGSVLRDRWAALAANVFGRVRGEINTGIANGETVAGIMSRLRGRGGALGAARRWVEIETRTAMAAMANAGREKTHEENQKIVQREQWTAVLDNRTCPECAALDGQVFKTGEGPRAPLHFRCRCHRAPITPTAKEMGYTSRELPAEKRRAMDGKVPPTVTYGQWLRRQSKARQNEVLGPTRAKLWRSGRVTLQGFTNRQHRLMTLEELAAREGLEL